MPSDEDIFANTGFGKAALKKMGTVPENFRLYFAGWIGAKPKDWTHMRVSGRVFRAVTKGPRAGRFDIPVPGTIVSVIVSREEILAANESMAKE